MEGPSPERSPELAEGRKALPPTGDQRGLVCRWCGCKHSHVIYTRPTWGGRTVQRREYRHCARRTTPWQPGRC